MQTFLSSRALHLQCCFCFSYFICDLWHSRQSRIVHRPVLSDIFHISLEISLWAIRVLAQDRVHTIDPVRDKRDRSKLELVKKL